ncbi:MAG: hypothetical protein RIQ81_1167 [Pseudomonadota bacterium]
MTRLWMLWISVTSCLLLRPDLAGAMDFHLAAGAVEGGDDRFQPTAGAGFTAPSGIIGTAWVYGRTYGPVQERAYILSGAQPFEPFGTKSISLLAGISVLMERTSVDGGPDADDTKDSSTNLGALFGLRGEIYKWKNFSLGATWESHIYPAGSQILLLVTGRKQLIGINVRVSL